MSARFASNILHTALSGILILEFALSVFLLKDTSAHNAKKPLHIIAVTHRNKFEGWELHRRKKMICLVFRV